VAGAGDYSHDRLGQEEVHGVRVARSSIQYNNVGMIRQQGGDNLGQLKMHDLKMQD